MRWRMAPCHLANVFSVSEFRPAGNRKAPLRAPRASVRKSAHLVSATKGHKETSREWASFFAYFRVFRGQHRSGKRLAELGLGVPRGSGACRNVMAQGREGQEAQSPGRGQEAPSQVGGTPTLPEELESSERKASFSGHDLSVNPTPVARASRPQGWHSTKNLVPAWPG